MNKQFAKIFVSLSLAIISLSLAQQEITTVAELERLAPLGGEYRLAAGTYELTEPLLLTKDLTLLGAGIGETIVSGSSPFYVISIESSEYFKFDGISFEYRGTGGSEVVEIADASFEFSNCSIKGAIYSHENDLYYGDGLHVYKNAHGTVNNCLFENNESNGISLEHTASLAVENSKLMNNATAVAVFEDNSFSIKDSVFLNNGSEDGSAIYAEGNSELLIDNNLFDGNLFGAFYFIGNSKITAITNTIKNSGDTYVAVTASENADLKFEENTISDNPLGSFSIFDNAKLLATSNNLRNNGNQEFSSIYSEAEAQIELIKNISSADWGWWFSGNSKLIAKGNVIDKSQSEGFAAITFTDSASAELSKNEIRNGLDWAVFATNNSQAVLLQNIIEDNIGGIQLGAEANVRLLVNKIRNNVEHGVYILDDSTAYISANTISNNRSGIVISDNAKADIIENKIIDNKKSGIGFLGNSDGSALSNNISGNAWNGIIVGDSANAKISANQIIGNLLRGILLTENATAKVDGNSIKNSKWGIFVSEDANLELADNIFENNETDSFKGALPDDEN